MAEKEELIVFSKADIIDAEHLEEMQEFFEEKTKKTVSMTISAGAYIHIEELKDLLIEKIPENSFEFEEIPEDSETTKVYDLKRRVDPKRCEISREANGDFRVTGERIEEIARMTDTRYTDGVGRVYDVMERFGVMRKVREILREEMLHSENVGFFEGEDDMKIPSIWIGDKKFSLEGLIFMKEG